MNFFSQMDNRIPYMNTSIRSQHKHEPAMKAVRLNGKITEVKQPQDQPNSKMGDHLGSIHFVFFQWQQILGKIRQICQMLLICLNFRKSQLRILVNKINYGMSHLFNQIYNNIKNSKTIILHQAVILHYFSVPNSPVILEDS